MMEKQFVLRLPEDVHKDIKTYAASSGITMQEYFNRLIDDALKKEKHIQRDYIQSDDSSSD